MFRPFECYERKRTNNRGSVSFAAGYCHCFNRVPGFLDNLFLCRQTGGIEAPRLVGGIAGLCTHPNIGGLCHSLSQLLAQGDYGSGTNVLIALDFLHDSGWRLDCRWSRALPGSVFDLHDSVLREWRFRWKSLKGRPVWETHCALLLI